MRIVDRIPAVVGFRVIPTTVLVLLTYLTIFTLVIVTDWLPEPPKNQNGLDLKQAYTDLRHITAHPHPYNSHYNDAVHDYILSRVRPVAPSTSFVHILDDQTSNGSWASPGYGVYFEGTNILVKIDGKSSNGNDGVLFSAHYDSVSTAPGVTDDGMGVVTLLQLIDYFAKHRPDRTAIFNINNGEEDWLNGAHAFLQHPWAKLTDTFLNLEGAAAGGCPILFRATSTSPVRAFRSDYVPHPHANVISSDAFARGVIRSGTDYSVYTGAGAEMEGLDVAFYKGRSRYHTKYDAVPYTNGGERSLWAMMETAQGAGHALLNAKRHKADQGSGGTPVYFDLLKAELVIFYLNDLLIYNVVSLVVGPISLIFFVVCEYVLRNERARQPNGHPVSRPSVLEWLKQRSWLRALWRRSKFWIALVSTIASQALLVWAFLAFNSFTVYSSPYLVLLSFFSLAYLSLVIPLTFTFSQTQSPTAKYIAPEREKHTLLIQVYIFTWILLLFSTIAVARAQVGGLYFVTVWNTGVWIACVLAAVEGMMLPVPQGGPRVRFHSAHHHHHREHEEDQDADDDDQDQRQPPTEATPLIGYSRASLRKPQEGGVVGWWIVHLLLTIPAPVLLIAQMGSLLLDSLPQTLADGSPAYVVYAAASLTAVLLAVPLTPFSGKLHRGLFFLVFLSFLIVTAYLWLAFPFSSADPLKVFFQQKVTLSNVVSERHSSVMDLSNSTVHPTAGVRKVVTALTGTPYYLENEIIRRLPSASDKELKCRDEKAKRGLVTCEWESALVPSPGGRNPWEDDFAAAQGRVGAASKGRQSWFKAELARTGIRKGQIVLQGRNTRSCRLYFDSRPITKYVVEGGQGGMQKGYEVGKVGASEVRLWSRTWDREFVVDFEWEDDDGREGEGITGRIACEWVEYESGNLDNGDGQWDLQRGGGERAKIPAFEEVLAFLPEWAVASKTTDGLVEAWSPFSV